MNELFEIIYNALPLQIKKRLARCGLGDCLTDFQREVTERIEYDYRVRQYEAQGMTRSDAQDVVNFENMKGKDHRQDKVCDPH